MKLSTVHLFVVLLLSFVFCSFLGGNCSSLEGFNMPSDSNSQPYDGKGQYSDQFSSYKDLYKANDKFSKEQDKAYDRKDKVLPSNPNDSSDSVSRYAPYRHGSNQGIPASQILPGQEDLYILKSSVVPPVCPACPAVRWNSSGGGGGGCGSEKKCPPCPPCARCPEPAFECKKVPNYSSSNDNILPRPVLNSFSQFGL